MKKYQLFCDLIFTWNKINFRYKKKNTVKKKNQHKIYL